jgi:hypothetical protein
LLDVTDVGVMLRRGSVEGHDPRRGRIGAHDATKLMRTACVPERHRRQTDRGDRHRCKGESDQCGGSPDPS